MKESATYNAYLAPGLTTLAALTILPIILVLYFSLRSWSLIVADSNVFTGLANFARMIEDARFWNSMWVSLYYIVVNTSLQLGFGLVLALTLWHDYKGTRIFRALFLLPMLAPPVVVGLTWRILFTPDLAGVNWFLSLIGVSGPDWLSNPAWARIGVTIAAVWSATPMVTLLLLAGLESLSKEPLESAYIDGASFLQTLRHVTLPLLKPVVLVVVMLRVIESLGILPIVFVMTGGGPVSATEAINLYAYDVGVNYLDIGYASSLLVAFMGLIALFASLFVRGALREVRS